VETNILQLTSEETIRYINAGIALHNADVSMQQTPYNAEDYLAAGYIREKYLEGVEVSKSVHNMVTGFVQAAFEREEVGSSMYVNGLEFVTKIQGSILVIYAGPPGKMIATIDVKGLHSPIKVNFGDGFSAHGQTIIRHGEVGKERKHAFLIDKYYPVSLVSAAIGFAARKPSAS
jgi:hypothetical protein